MKQKSAYIKKATKAFMKELGNRDPRAVLPYILPFFLSEAYDQGMDKIMNRVKEIANDPLPVAVDKLKKESSKRIRLQNNRRRV